MIRRTVFVFVVAAMASASAKKHAAHVTTTKLAALVVNLIG